MSEYLGDCQSLVRGRASITGVAIGQRSLQYMPSPGTCVAACGKCFHSIDYLGDTDWKCTNIQCGHVFANMSWKLNSSSFYGKDLDSPSGREAFEWWVSKWIGIDTGSISAVYAYDE